MNNEQEHNLNPEMVEQAIKAGQYEQAANILNEQGMAAYYQKDHENAAAFYRQGLEILENIPEKTGWMVYLNLLNNLGIVYIEQGLYQDAAPLLEEALAIKGKILGETHPTYIISLNNLAQLKNHTGDFRESCRMTERCVAMIRENYNEDFPDFDNYLNNLGEAYRNLGEYSKAIEIQRNCLEMREKKWGLADEKTLTTRNNLGLALYEAGEIAEASVVYLDALEKMKGQEFRLVPLSPMVMMNMGNLCQTQSDYASAEKYFLQSAEIVKKTLGLYHPYLANIYSSLGNVFILTGNFTQAEKWLLEAKTTAAMTSTTHPWYVSVLNNLGHLYVTVGRQVEGEQALKEAMAIEQKARGADTVLSGKIMTNLAVLYQAMGLYEEAEKVYENLLNLYRQVLGENHPEFALGLNNLGLLYSYIGQYTKAETAFIQAKKIIITRLSENHPLVGTTTGNLAEVYRVTGNYEAAESHLKRGLEILVPKQGDDHPDVLTLKNNLALTYSYQKKYEAAESIFSEMLGKWDPRHPHFPVVLSNLAELYYQQGRMDEAENALRQSISLMITRIRTTFHILSEKEKQGFYQTLKFNIDWLQTFGVERYNTNPDFAGFMYDILLATKGILIQSGLRTREVILQSDDEALRDKYILWKEKKEELSWYYALKTEEISRYTAAIEALEQEANQLEKDLVKASQPFAENTISTPHWRNIRDQLQPGEAAVEIARFLRWENSNHGAPAYLALIITADTSTHPQLVLIPDAEDIETRLVRGYQQMISSGEVSFRSYTISEPDTEAGHWKPTDFYEKLWKPVADYLAEKKSDRKVFLSPESVYNKFNLHTLPLPEGGYLMDKTEVHILSSTREIRMPDAPKPTNKTSLRAVLIGAPDYELSESNKTPEPKSDKVVRFRGGFNSNLDPLPGTRREVERIGQLLKENDWETAVFLDKEANEYVIKSLSRPRVLHIATHGFFMEVEAVKPGLPFLGNPPAMENPLLRAGLFLAGAGVSLKKMKAGEPGTQDGIFTAYEAANLDLRGVELVVLSACETGLGEVKNGEGVYGLQRAFLMAGAETLLLSLWKVSDQATQELMENFYRLWLESGDKRKAFHRAQLSLREKYPSPYYWGAFVMVGR